MRQGVRVEWDRRTLPTARGTAIEVTDLGMVKVRDDHGVLYWFPEDQLKEVG